MSLSLEFDGEFRMSPARGFYYIPEEILSFLSFSFVLQTDLRNALQKYKFNGSVFKVTRFPLACENTCDEKRSST